MTDLDLENIYVESDSTIPPWDELLKSTIKTPEKLLSSTSSLSNSTTSKTKFSLKSSIKLNKDSNNCDNRVVTINEIVTLNCEILKVPKILEYQYVITKHLKNNLKNLKENKNELVKKMIWLRESVKYMSNKMDLVNIPFIKKSTDSSQIIPRSSYKFCKYNYKCKYLYKDNCITNSCYEQHIVFNYLYNDIDNLINYIITNIDYDLNEIQKCINTIYFVVNHNKEELENLRDITGCDLNIVKITKA